MTLKFRKLSFQQEESLLSIPMYLWTYRVRIFVIGGLFFPLDPSNGRVEASKKLDRTRKMRKLEKGKQGVERRQIFIHFFPKTG